jgi:hypothetical protein
MRRKDSLHSGRVGRSRIWKVPGPASLPCAREAPMTPFVNDYPLHSSLYPGSRSSPSLPHLAYAQMSASTTKNFTDITPLGPRSKAEPVANASPQFRTLDRVVVPMDTSDGAGVSLRRSIGGPKIPNLDPFLLLDEFKSDDVRSFGMNLWVCVATPNCLQWPTSGDT